MFNPMERKRKRLRVSWTTTKKNQKLDHNREGILCIPVYMFRRIFLLLLLFFATSMSQCVSAVIWHHITFCVFPILRLMFNITVAITCFKSLFHLLNDHGKFLWWTYKSSLAKIYEFFLFFFLNSCVDTDYALLFRLTIIYKPNYLKMFWMCASSKTDCL